MRAGTCIHYHGYGMGRAYKTECCGAGVNFFETFDGRKDGIFCRMPCIQYHVLPAHRRGTLIKPGEPTVREAVNRQEHEMIPCPHFQEPTPEQVEEDQKKWQRELNNVTVALCVATKWRTKGVPDSPRAEVVECPICNGRLHLSQSSINGHVAGTCETKGCVQWIE